MRSPFLSLLVVLILLGCGCGGASEIAYPPDHFANDPEGVPVQAAARCLGQKENWADRAEYAVVKTDAGWEVTAWRVEYPSAKGPERYKPWGFRIMTITRDNRVIAFKSKRS